MSSSVEVPRPTLDLRLVPAALAVWAATWAGVPMATRHPGVVLALAGLGIVAAGVLWFRGIRVLGLAVAVAATGLLVAVARGGADTAGPLPALVREQATARIEAVIVGPPRPLTGRVRGDRRLPDEVITDVTVRLVRARGLTTVVRTPARVVAAPTGWDHLAPGDHVELTGRLAADSGAGVLLRAHGPPRLVGAASWWQRAANRVRSGLRAASADLPADSRALLPGLVVGDTSGMPADLRDDFRATGLSHLTAVSGGNLAIVVGAALWVARWCGVRGRWLVLSALVAMLGFVVVAGPEPSVLRAAVMGLVGLLALFGGRRRRGLPALAAAALVLLLLDARLARSYGFALSVLATAGLVLWARPWGHAVAARLSMVSARPTWARLSRVLGYAFAVPVAAQVAVAPVLVLLAAQVSLVAVPANLLAAPAVPPATVIGLVAALTSLVSPGLARLCAQVAAVPVSWIAEVGRVGATVPLGVLPWLAGVPGALALAALLGATALLVHWAARGRWRQTRMGARVSDRLPPRSGVVLALAATVAVVIGARLPAVLTGPWPPPGWALVACDVGQGDALVLPVAARTVVVIDAGPDPAAVDACLDDLGVRRVALLVLTHLHADHVEGVPGVLDGRTVDQVLVGPYDEPEGEQHRVAAWLRAAGVPVRLAAPGDRWSMGATALTVLGPRRVIDEGSVPNNASVVLRAESAGVSVLLTGDVEPPAQQALIDGPLRTPGVLPVDVLKVPHHGSAAQLPELIGGTGARVAVISVGEGNDYGHPATVTLTALRRSGALIERTDRDGSIAVVGPEDRLRVVEH